MWKLILIALSWAAATQSALAYCREPGRAPEAPRAHEKPRAPLCLRDAQFGRVPDCDPYELNRYQRDMEQYVNKLRKYAHDSRVYADAAQAYAQCEIRMIEQGRNF